MHEFLSHSMTLFTFFALRCLLPLPLTCGAGAPPRRIIKPDQEPRL
jgi:hypothetical protein